MQVPVAVQQHLPILRDMGTRDAAGGKELLELLENARRCFSSSAGSYHLPISLLVAR